MAKCWQMRGCDDEMQSNCPHPTEFLDNCPTKCAFAACSRTSHMLTTDPELIFDLTVDRSEAIRDVCLFCEFFLKNAPRAAS